MAEMTRKVVIFTTFLSFPAILWAPEGCFSQKCQKSVKKMTEKWSKNGLLSCSGHLQWGFGPSKEGPKRAFPTFLFGKIGHFLTKMATKSPFWRLFQNNPEMTLKNGKNGFSIPVFPKVLYGTEINSKCISSFLTPCIFKQKSRTSKCLKNRVKIDENVQKIRQK